MLGGSAHPRYLCLLPRRVLRSANHGLGVRARCIGRNPAVGRRRGSRGERDIDPTSFDFSQNPDLTSRIAESPHAYFRFVGHRFAAAVCKRFEAQATSMPRVRLHGDPHVEQYAVTDLGRWIGDYDDASIGPASIDLVRFGTSAILAGRQHGLSAAQIDGLIAALFRGYAEGLKRAQLPKDPPAFASALNAKFAPDRKGFLEMADKSTLPTEPAEEKLARDKLDTYVGDLKKVGKAPKNGFFTVKRVGRLKLGIGSALTKKYLFRLEGPSNKPDDDVIVELKEVADLSQVPCVTPVPDGAASARADEQALPPAGRKLLAPALLPDGRFWVNEWLSNYQEARIKKLKGEDLESLVFESGIMLGREHTKPVPGAGAPTGDKLLPGDADAAALKRAMTELADASTRGWERFTKEVAVAKAP